MASSLSAAADAGPGSDGTVGVRSDVYADEQIVVVSPAARGSATIGEAVEIDAGFALDILSGATPLVTTDAITSATYFSETRRGANAGIVYRPTATWRIQGAAAVSVESDHETVAPSAGAAVELFDRLSTLALDYSFLHERVGLADDPSYEQLTLGHVLDLRWTQILGRTTVVTALLTGATSNCDEQLGCQANPYRRVALQDQDGSIFTSVRERHPRERLRGSGALQFAQHLGHALALHLGYRLYGDSWHMSGHTGDLALAKSLLDRRLDLRVEGRFTWQEPVYFHRGGQALDPTQADAIPLYRTGDRELGRMYDLLAGTRASARIPLPRDTVLRVHARVARIWYRYLDHAVLDARNAWVVGAGLSVEY